MKLIIPLLLLASNICKGQHNTASPPLPTYGKGMDDLPGLQTWCNPCFDTIRIVMLCADTANHGFVLSERDNTEMDAFITNHTIFWKHGYEVRELHHPMDLATDMHGN